MDQLENAVFAFSASSTYKDPRQRVYITVVDPDGNQVIEQKLSIGSKLRETQHKIKLGGLYEMCFELKEGKTPVRVFFHVDYKPLSADGKDNSRKVGKDDMSNLDLQLQSVDTRLKEISLEIEHARIQENLLKAAVESTAESVWWFSILSIVILLSASIWQIIYLRSFFVSKKLL